MFFERALGAKMAAFVLLWRFQAKRDLAGEVIVIHAAGKCVLHELQGLIECTPRKRDGFDLDVTLGIDASENASPFSRPVLMRAVVEEEITVVPIDGEPGTECPGALREHVGQLLSRCDDADAVASMRVHHRSPPSDLSAMKPT